VSFTGNKRFHMLHPLVGSIDDIIGECEGNISKEEEMTLQQENQPSLSSLVTSALFQSWHCKD